MNISKQNRTFTEAVNTAELLKAQQSNKMSEVEDNAKEVQNPVYADATRQMKKTAEVKEETVKVEKEEDHSEKAKNPKMATGAKKMKLDEALFEDTLDDYYDGKFDSEDEEGICPECGTPVEYSEGEDHLVIVDTEAAYYSCSCPNCGSHWKEWHEIQLNFSHYQPVESLKAKMAREAQPDSLDDTSDDTMTEALYQAQEVFSDEENKTFSKAELGMVDKDKLSDEDRRMIARRKLGLDKKPVYIDPKDSWTEEEKRNYARQELGLAGGADDATPNYTNRRRYTNRNN